MIENWKEKDTGLSIFFYINKQFKFVCALKQSPLFCHLVCEN